MFEAIRKIGPKSKEKVDPVTAYFSKVYESRVPDIERVRVGLKRFEVSELKEQLALRQDTLIGLTGKDLIKTQREIALIYSALWDKVEDESEIDQRYATEIESV